MRIQVADFICGSLGRVYDIKKCDGFGQAYFQIIEPQVIRIEQYPKLYSNFSFDTSAIASGYDKEIAKLCYSRAVTYIQNAAINDDYSKARVIVLKYLLFKFMNYDENGYISTRELILQLEHTELKDISNQTFRSKIIGKMRDEKIIIASSSKGYKIPSKMSEIKDYVYHDARVVMPMLDRLNNCRNLVKLNTLNNVDLLDGTSFERLKWYFDNYPSEVKNTAK